VGAKCRNRRVNFAANSPLPAGGSALAAAVRPADQCARTGIHHDCLRAAHAVRPLRYSLDGVAAAPEFAEATGGADRAETMEMLDRLNRLLGELDRLTAQLHPEVN